MFIWSGFCFREEIVIWARKKTGVPVIRISSVKEAEEFLKKYHTYVVGFFENFEVCYMNCLMNLLNVSVLVT